MTAVMQLSGAGAPDVEIAIIGTGFSGLGMAIRLRQQGEDNFLLLEKADDYGGTWRDNHYPGCACDVPSHLYSFSFEQNPDWSRAFSPQAEILAYLKRCADKYGLREKTRFGAEVVGSRWDEQDCLWRIELANGDRLSARVVVGGFGGLSRPAWPQVDGLERFRGTAFHSQQWDHDCDLRGKRVAVIGTGASAIQIIPEVQQQAGRLTVFQRTAPWVLPKPDRRFSALEKAVYRRLPAVQNALRIGLYWQHEWRVLPMVKLPQMMKPAALLGKRHIRRQVSDPALRARVTPDYTMGCKRILLSNDYYPALDQPNVDVVPHGVREIRAHSIIAADGSEHPVDVIVFATGFDVTNPVGEQRYIGRGGEELGQRFAGRGMEAYLGSTISGFPNLFLLMGPNSGLTHNSMVFMIESQIQYVLDALRTMRRQKLVAVDVDEQVLARFNRRLQARFAGSIWTDGGCNSWYLDGDGRNFTLWPDFTWRYRLRTRRFRMTEYRCVFANPDKHLVGLPERTLAVA